MCAVVDLARITVSNLPCFLAGRGVSRQLIFVMNGCATVWKDILLISLNILLCCFNVAGRQIWQNIGWEEQWNDWWHYRPNQIGGPNDWGSPAHMIYSSHIWASCKTGHLQSPINISTDKLVFDHSLKELQINGSNIPLTMMVENIGQDLHLTITQGDVYFSGGPLSYRYRLFGGLVKFGSTSEKGSDHQIDGRSFPGELQFYAYNSDLYTNFTHAMDKPHGLTAIAVFFTLSEKANKDMLAIVAAAEKTVYRGETFQLKGVELQSLLPSLNHYMTYEGSLPFPACLETVTWLVLNQPIKITETELKMLRNLKVSHSAWSNAMADNYRPVQSLNNRSIRTNIEMTYKDSSCKYERISHYSANFPNS